MVAVLGGMSRAEGRRLVELGEVTVDGGRLPGRERLRAGQVVSFPEMEVAAPLQPEEVQFGVVYEDADIVVVDKPSGLTVHPGAGHATGTLAGGILARYPQVEGVGDPERWGLVHRLDRDTSGLMVVALTAPALAGLKRQVAARRMERVYSALAEGRFPIPTGTIDAPIARDPARPTRRRVDAQGKPARTHYEVAEEFAESTLLKVRLETGRTHQIRVHLAAIDHPVVGDALYRRGPDRFECPRLFLHACRLVFDHPADERPVSFDAPLPPELAALVDALRREAADR